MGPKARTVTWQAPEHHHVEKNGDWFWILWIVAITGAVIAFFFDDFLLSILIIIATTIMASIANRKPNIVSYAISTRGLRVDNTLYPFSSLDAFFINENSPRGPELLVRSKKLFMHMIVMPLPLEHIEDIEDILEVRLPEEQMEEPFAARILEIFGF